MMSVATETCCKSIPKHVRNAEGHGQGDRNCQRHDERETPFPKSNQGHPDYQDDRFHQSTQEQMNVFLNLQG